MIEFKLGQVARIPVRLLASSGTPMSAVAYTAVTITVEKADGTTSNFMPTNAQWIEMSVGAFASQGKYTALLPSSYCDKPGPLTYAVSAAGADTYIGFCKVVAYEQADTFAIVGGPLTIHTSGQYANHMTIYASDGITPLYRYALYDKNGSPTTTEIYRRVPVSV